jgi:hypothetical protein
VRDEPFLLRDCLPLGPKSLRVLWGRTLLTLHGSYGSRSLLVRHLVGRLEWRPDEAAALLPILACVLRSVRGPAWREGLAAVVRLAERRPDVVPLIRENLPELKL